MNVSTVLVNADGTSSKIHTIAGIPPVTFYTFVMAPGSEGVFNIELAKSSTYPGQVFNAQTRHASL
jgi:hypothetical protein